MEQVKKTGSGIKQFENPIIQMIEDKKRIVEALKKGESLSTLKGIKIVSLILPKTVRTNSLLI